MKSMAIAIVIFVLIGQSAYSINPDNTSYNKAVTVLNSLINAEIEENEKIQAQKDYLKWIQELSINKCDDLIVRILKEHWINVSINNEENDWETKTIFSATIKSIIPSKYSGKTKKMFLLFESFIFNPNFFDYGKQAIMSELIYSGLYKKEPDYIIDLILRILEDDNLSYWIKIQALQLSNYVIVNKEKLTEVNDRINKSKRFQKILNNLIEDTECDSVLRMRAKSRIAEFE